MNLKLAIFPVCLCGAALLCGCFIVTDDKPANSAPTAPAATTPAAPTATEPESMRTAPQPPPLSDGG
jgi:hypothetical protein